MDLRGSFHCGPCRSGFVGNQTLGCRNHPGLCPDGTVCDPNAECVRPTRRTSFHCEDRFTNVLRERLGPTPTFRKAAEIDRGAEFITYAIKGSLEASKPRHRPKMVP
uniref:Uncharacterized protein n=1 Tax=Timema genevievae TaxID=629358 RepID=A0A7R9PQ82_TIMGE|nr:unnamed protein product [Timema genevievae]